MTKVTRPLQKDRHYWLLKSDADSFSFEDLWNLPTRTTHWDGVRNFQARNFMRDEMKKGDLAFFYHSGGSDPVSYTHLRAHETRHDLVCRLLLEKKKNK